jgi:hypothetical protein
MTKFYKKKIDDLEEEINELFYDDGDALISCEKAVELILSKISELKIIYWKKASKHNRKKSIFLNTSSHSL